MSLQQMQKEVDQWIGQYQDGYWPPHELLAHMMEELGEMAREINHLYGKKKKKTTEADNTIANEVGDLLFNIACLANALEIDLDEAFASTMHKARTRDANRFEKK